LVPRDSASWGEQYKQIKSLKPLEELHEENRLAENIEHMFLTFSTFRKHCLNENRKSKYYDTYDIDFDAMEKTHGKSIYSYLSFIFGEGVKSYSQLFVGTSDEMFELSVAIGTHALRELLQKWWGEFDYNDLQNESVLLKSRMKIFLKETKKIGISNISYMINQYFRGMKKLEKKKIDELVLKDGTLKSDLQSKMKRLEKRKIDELVLKNGILKSAIESKIKLISQEKNTSFRIEQSFKLFSSDYIFDPEIRHIETLKNEHIHQNQLKETYDMILDLKRDMEKWIYDLPDKKAVNLVFSYFKLIKFPVPRNI